MLPSFDYTISLGSLLTLIGAVSTALIVISTFKAKIDALLELHSSQLETMREDLKEHREEDVKRFDTMNDRLFDLVSSVQRLVGQVDPRRIQ